MNNTEYDFSAAADTAREKVQQALTTVRDRTDDAVARSGQYVRDRPATSLLSAFAVGVAVGVVVAIAVRPSEPAPALADSIDDSKHRLAEFFGTLSENLRGPLSKTYESMSEGASTLSDSVARVFGKIPPPKKFGWW